MADDQMTADDAGITRPFDLVNEFATRQRAMRPGGGGLGPYGQRKSPTYLAQLRDRYMSQRPAQAGEWNRTPNTMRKAGLMEWNGHKIDSSVYRYADAIARQFPGLRFSSGYRDPAHNRRVNGVPNSYHLSGRALDFSGSARDMQAAKVWAQRNGAREALIHNAGSGTHLHVAW